MLKRITGTLQGNSGQNTSLVKTLNLYFFTTLYLSGHLHLGKDLLFLILNKKRNSEICKLMLKNKHMFAVDSPARSEAATDSDLGDLIPGLNYRCLVPKCQKIIQVSRQGGHRITDTVATWVTYEPCCGSGRLFLLASGSEKEVAQIF